MPTSPVEGEVLNSPSPVTQRKRRELHRIRTIAGISLVLGLLKILPVLEIFITPFEWIVVKNILPMLLAIGEDVTKRDVTKPRSLATIMQEENWYALLRRNFSGGSAIALLLLDLGIDAETLILPFPFDGLDIPAPLIDGVVLLAAHWELKKAMT